MRLAVLASGRGTNLVALAQAIEAGKVPATLALVAADRACPALHWAADRAYETFLRPAREIGMPAWETELLAALQSQRVDALVLAGFMRVLSGGFVARYPERILNVHPSLLPAFPGLDAIGQAVRHGVRVTGVTVHLVDQGLDEGPIVLQEALPILQDETQAALEARVHEVEHRLLPEAVRLLCLDRLAVHGRIVHITEG
jgi:phosphoribosylglycinamide formyltransferase-1